MIAPWPEPAESRDPAAEAEWADVMAVTRAARTLRADYGIEPARVVPASIAVPRAERADFWRRHADLLGALPGTRLNPVDIVDALDGASVDLAARSIAAVTAGVELLIPAEGLFDVRSELARADQERTQTQAQVQRLEKLLGSDFARKAPPETVQRERERLADQRARLETLERRRATLARLGAE
jgi:valyl-tRNA synthetase